MGINGVKKLMCAAVMAGILLSAASCKAKRSDFPTLPEPTSDESIPLSLSEETGETDTDEEVKTLSVALPYSPETVDYLYRLYYAKISGYWNDSLSGEDVDLDYLASLESPMTPECIYVPNEGVSSDSLASWGDDLPDIFLTNDMKGVREKGLCLPLQDLLFDNELLDASSFYPASLRMLTFDGDVDALPYYCSVPLIYGNKDFIPASGNLDFRCSLETFREYMDEISRSYDDVVVFTKAYQLIPYIASAFDGKDVVGSYMLKDEYLTDKTSAQGALDAAADFVSGLYDRGLSANYTDDGTDPVYSRRCAMWIASSSDLELWSGYYPEKLYFSQVPVSETGDEVVPYLTLFPVCVSSKTDIPEEAGDFAAFLALDEDAILLADRLEHKIGFLPLSSSDDVWDRLKNDEKFGYIASVYENRMDEARFTFKVLDNPMYEKTELMLFDHYSNDEPDSDMRLENIYG